MVRFFIIYISLLLTLVSACSFAETNSIDMASRAKQSLAKDRSYEMVSVKAFWGDAAFLNKCTSQKQLPEPFVIYFEVLANGRLGKTLFVPLTETGSCIKENTKYRVFPKPPNGSYVTKIEMSFKK